MKDIFLNVVKEALGNDLDYFKVYIGEIIEDDEEFYCCEVVIDPKDFEHEGVEHVGIPVNLMMQIDDDDVHILVGEDQLLKVTELSLYKQMFWNGAMREATD